MAFTQPVAELNLVARTIRKSAGHGTFLNPERSPPYFFLTEIFGVTLSYLKQRNFFTIALDPGYGHVS